MSVTKRQKGENLLVDGCVLIDCSGRTKSLGEKSVLGVASKDFEYSVLMTMKDKRRVYSRLCRKHFDKRAKAIMHSVKLFYGIKDYLDSVPAFYICSDGFDSGLLKHHLKLLFSIRYHEKKINIQPSLKSLFGKKNIADRLAAKVRRGGGRPGIKLTEKHFEKLGLI